MTTSAEFLASEQAKKLPDWIKMHPDWRHHGSIEKVFPSLGLVNCNEPCSTKIIDYSTDVPKLRNMYICFSSDGIEGMWDIATMSMRGALSCRHWDNPHAKASYNLIGDMTNPYLGIIYLSDGNMTEYGLSINKRALVKYEPARPALPGIRAGTYIRAATSAYMYLDRIYAKTTNTDPVKYINTDMDPNTRDIFKNFLKNKLNNKGKAQTAIR